MNHADKQGSITDIRTGSTDVRTPFDVIHDTQKAFRKLVKALSFPGTLVSLADEAAGLDLELDVPPGMAVLGRVVLDGECGFCSSSSQLALALDMMTLARRRESESADFIFCGGEQADFLDLLARSCPGTLIDPHQSATLIVEADFGPQAPVLVLTGPGIQDCLEVHLDLCPGWLEARAEKNAEFPLGVDLYLVDRQNRLMALPRTTKCTKK